MTLTQWFRGYFFNPITRSLRRNKKLPAPLIIFITQISTMLVIGLWHGITPNFVIWGLWHGLGYSSTTAGAALPARRLRPWLSGGLLWVKSST